MEEKKLTLKRPITLKVIVTQAWKEDAQQQLQAQINQLDQQVQQLDFQGQRAIAEITKQGGVLPNPQISQQIDNIQIQVNQKKSEILNQKNQFLQQMQYVQQLELEEEVSQTQLESFFRLGVGDNLVKKMNVEIVIRDGVVQEIRGDM
jgi:hypothetical protein